MYRKFYAFYLDRGYYFDYEKLREFLRKKNIIINYNFITSHKSIDMIEIMNRILKKIVRKFSKD